MLVILSAYPRSFLTIIYELLNPGGLIYIHVPNEHHFGIWPFGGQFDYTPNVHIVNYSQDNVADLLGHIGFSSCKIVGPIFKSTGAGRERF